MAVALPDSPDLADLCKRIAEALTSSPQPPETRVYPDVKKVVVAVHGIGDQFRSATVQAVAHRFCRYMGRPAAIPLGQFYHPDVIVASQYVPGRETVEGGFSGDLGFLEVYWANIPREPVQEAHTLEEPKQWAHTIVERLHLRIAETRREQAEKRLEEAATRLDEAAIRLDQDRRGGTVAGPHARAMRLQEARGLQEEAGRLQEEARSTREAVDEARRRADADLARTPPPHPRPAAFGQVARAMEEAREAEEAARRAEARARDAELKALAAESSCPGVGDDPERARLVKKAELKAGLARTIASPPTHQHDYQLMAQVIEELITGVAVADRLSFVATKMGLSHGFDLKKLLDDYLNDVQLVTEFGHYRDRMRKVFFGVMDAVRVAYPNADIYIVAHSEGTVVSFLGLLAGLANGEPWIGKVRGLLTIGSPLNKHVILWPEIFEEAYPERNTSLRLDGKIAWRNYYDYGDPIGFDLGPTREWMEERQLQEFFEFNGPEDAPAPNHDHGFTRYVFPGAAHNDYWHDGQLFGHFIQEVVDARPPILYPHPPRRTYGIPRTKLLALLTSYVIPYALAAALMFVSTLVLYQAVRGYIAPEDAKRGTARDAFRNVAGFASLIGGMTAMARLPRLTRANRRAWRYWRARGTGIALFAAGATAFHYGVSGAMLARLIEPLGQRSFGFRMATWAAILAVPLVLLAYALHRADRRLSAKSVIVAALLGVVAIWGLWENWEEIIKYPSAVLIAIAALVGIEAWILSRKYPELGLKPLLYTGAVVIADIVASRIASAKPGTETAPIWPVILAGLAFLYLWWLAALTFDLTYVWHSYIRRSAALEYLRQVS